MRPFILCLLVGVICAVIIPAQYPGNGASSEGSSFRDTPPKLLEAWLRFHETDLCQGVNAVFEFRNSGMKIWCLIEDQKSYQKLLQLLEPLADHCQIELCATGRPAGKQPDDDRDPPASLWENEELRSYLGDLYAPIKPRSAIDVDSPDIMKRPMSFSDLDILKHLLLIYEEQILEYNGKMERYATDLPALARVAADHDVATALKQKATAACWMHSQGLIKYVDKLNANLTPAIPKPKKRKHVSSPSEYGSETGKTVVDKAEQISATAQNVARRVHNFIHPENFTVDLDELRQPSLLESLKEMRGMLVGFQKGLGKPFRK
jgi:hypothetical protein